MNCNFKSAGTNIRLCNKEGTQPLTENLLVWADEILVMEERHRKQIVENGGSQFGKKIKVLHIPDIYKYYQKELLELLEGKTKKILLN